MQSIRSSDAKDSLRKSAVRMTTAAAALSVSLSRAILEPEFPEEEERIKKGKLVRERSHISHIILDKCP